VLALSSNPSTPPHPKQGPCPHRAFSLAEKLNINAGNRYKEGSTRGEVELGVSKRPEQIRKVPWRRALSRILTHKVWVKGILGEGDSG
jgi:hypothetical protein